MTEADLLKAEAAFDDCDANGGDDGGWGRALLAEVRRLREALEPISRHEGTAEEYRHGARDVLKTGMRLTIDETPDGDYLMLVDR